MSAQAFRIVLTALQIESLYFSTRFISTKFVILKLEPLFKRETRAMRFFSDQSWQIVRSNLVFSFAELVVRTLVNLAKIDEVINFQISYESLPRNPQRKPSELTPPALSQTSQKIPKFALKTPIKRNH